MDIDSKPQFLRKLHLGKHTFSLYLLGGFLLCPCFSQYMRRVVKADLSDASEGVLVCANEGEQLWEGGEGGFFGV